MTRRLDWNVEADSGNIRKRAIELRGLVAQRVYTTPFLSRERALAFIDSPRTQWRWRAMQKAELFMGTAFGGTVLEIGAGTAWCSALVTRKPNVETVFALDYDAVSVDHIMPNCFRHLHADVDKIVRALGSFNAVGLPTASVDVAISIGALHHSESLEATFREMARVLRPGGIFVASEPCEPDSVTNARRHFMENRFVDRGHVDKLYGTDVGEVRESDNSDHNYRLVDYLHAALSADFEAYPYTFQLDTSEEAGRPSADADRLDRAFIDRVCYDGFRKLVLPPYFAVNYPSDKVLFDPLLLIVRKPG